MECCFIFVYSVHNYLSCPQRLHIIFPSFIIIINAKNFHGSLTTVVRAQNDTPKTANIVVGNYRLKPTYLSNFSLLLTLLLAL